MKDFDGARAERRHQDRSFRIGGQPFTRRASVRPEVLVGLDTGIDKSTPSDELAAIDEAILGMIEPHDEHGDAHDRYRALRRIDGDDALTLGDLNALLAWLAEAATGRPTEPSASSSASPPILNGSTPSTLVSASPASPSPTPSLSAA